MAKTNVSTLLDEVKKTVDARGEDATVQALRNARNIDDNSSIQFIINIVCTQFSISREKLAKEKTDVTKYAKGFIVYYLRTSFNTEWSIIKVVLDHKDQSWLYDLMKLVKELKPKLPAHVTWLSAKEKMDKQIKNFSKSK